MNSVLGVLIYLVLIAIPVIILYFIIKLAVKHAIKELKRENVL